MKGLRIALTVRDAWGRPVSYALDDVSVGNQRQWRIVTGMTAADGGAVSGEVTVTALDYEPGAFKPSEDPSADANERKR